MLLHISESRDTFASIGAYFVSVSPHR